MRWYAFAVFAAIISLSVWGCCGLTKHAIVAFDKWGDAAPAKGQASALVAKAADAVPSKADEQQITGQLVQAVSSALDKYAALAPALRKAVQDTAANLNRPCRGAAGPDACGTLAEANKVMAKAGDEIVTTQIQERAAVPHFVAAMDSFTNAGLGMKQNSEDLSALLKSQAIQRSLDNFASMTESGSGILGDGRKIADKETADFLKPVPWWMRPIKRTGEAIDITAAIARNFP